MDKNKKGNKKAFNKGQPQQQKKKVGKAKAKHAQKFEDKIVDYFPRGNQGQGDDFMFNKAPIFKKREKTSEIQRSFQKKTKQMIAKNKRNKLMDIEDSDDDMFYSTAKQQQTEDALFNQDETFFNSLKQDFTSFFMLNKSQLASIVKIPQIKFKEGTAVLGAVCDKGPNGRYLEINLSRNRKGYIARHDACEDDQEYGAENFKIGEFVQGVVVPSVNEKKMQISLKASDINKGLNFEDIFVGMVLQGQIESQEDFGYKINVFSQDKCAGFLRTEEELEMNKCHMFTVKSKDEKKKILQLSAFEAQSTAKLGNLDSEDMMGLDLSSMVKPGNLVNGIVNKVLENGLLIKFNKIFHGFVFQDHLEGDLSEYKAKQKVQARIIITDYANKQINLSLKKEHIEMKKFDINEQNYQIGQICKEGFQISRCLFGNSFMVDIKGQEGVKAFLHAQHIEENEDYKEGYEVKKALKIKEINYFEHYPIVSANQDELQKRNILWSNIEVGQNYKGKIVKITQKNNQYRVLVQLSDQVKGIVDHNNISDFPINKLPLNIAQDKKVTVNVLAVDEDQKSLSLSLKHTFVSNDRSIITAMNKIDIGQAYNGYILAALKFGYLISFHNELTGVLTYKDIEELNKQKRGTYKIGQSVLVYVTFVNSEESKIGLSLSDKGVSNSKLANQVHKKSGDLLKNIMAIESDGKFENDIENVQVGGKYEYIVDKKASEHQSEYLILKSKEGKHRAVVLKQHLSDYSEHYEAMFNYYKNNQSNPKFSGIVIGKLESGYALVTLKPTIINNPDHYKTNIGELKKGDIQIGYADFQTNKGLIVKINEEFKGFAQISENRPASINYGDSLILHVRKIEGDKIYFLIANPYQISHANLKQAPFFNFLNEEFLINRKFINQAPKKWLKYKTGNIVEGKVSLIKEYGVVLNIEHSQGQNITGFITNDNLVGFNKKNLKIDQVLKCQILDIDYEKEIIDLQTSKQEKNISNLEKSLKNNNNNNNNKKQQQQQQLKVRVLLKKEQYQICENENNMILLAERKTLNDQNQEEGDIEEEQQEQKQKQEIFVIQINNEVYGKNVNDVNGLNKGYYLPICQTVNNKSENNEQQQQEKQQQDKKQNNQVQIGGVVKGTVKNVKSTGYTIQLGENHIARLHKNQADSSIKYEIGKEIQAKILFVKKDKHLMVELTNLKEHMKAKELNEKVNLPHEIEEFVEKYQGQMIEGVVKSIDVNSINPIYVEFSHEHQGFVPCFTGLSDFVSGKLSEEVEKIRNLKKKYSVGQRIKVYVQGGENLRNIEVSLVKNVQNLDIGAVRIGKICGNNGKKLRIQVDQKTFGSADILQVSDEWVADPLNKFRKGELVPLRIIGEQSNGEFELSLRESFLNKNNWEKALSPATGTTLNFKKMFGEQEMNGDLRNRIYKLGPGCLKVGMIVIGYVNQCNNNGCFIQIAHNLVARGQLNELSDSHIKKPESHFIKNRLVIARVIKIKEDGKIDVSLRESVLKHGYCLGIDQMKVGMKVKGIVSGHQKGKAVVQIENCKYRGHLSGKDYEIEENQKQSAYVEVLIPKGKEINVVITQVVKEPVKIKLSGLKKDFEKYSGQEFDFEQEFDLEKASQIQTLIDSVEQICQEQKNSKGKNNQKNDIGIEVEEEDEDEEEVDEEQYQEYEEFPDSEDENDMIIKNALQEQEEDDDEEEDEEDDQEEDEIEDEDDVINEISESSDDEEEEQKEDVQEKEEKKKNRRQKEKLKHQKEEEIRKEEQRLLDENAVPTCVDDFERLILKNPNSSYIWVKYMAFKMEQEGIEAARQIADRSLNVINFRNDSQQLNIWTAYMNLEHNFGSEKNLIDIFQKAMNKCKPKLVYFRLIDIYKTNGKIDLLVQLSKNMIKKFKHSSKVWLEHIKNIAQIKADLVKEGSSEASKYDLKEILKRALQCVKKQKHIIILSQYARLMYTMEEPEQGRTTFEAILQNYPKRTDIWSVYLDIETKYGNQQAVRNLYERCISMEFKPRKMKFFFKRYLQYELQFGSQEKAEVVKQKAQEYVQNLLGNDQEGEDIEEENGEGMEEEQE